MDSPVATCHRGFFEVKMKKLIIVSIFLMCAAVSHAASNKGMADRQWESYSDTGKEKSIELTLSSSAGVVSTVTVPSWAKGFRLYPRTNAIRFSVRLESNSSDVNISSTVASSAISIAEDNLGRGGIAKPDGWETRLLPADATTRLLYLRSATSSVVVDVEFF